MEPIVAARSAAGTPLGSVTHDASAGVLTLRSGTGWVPLRYLRSGDRILVATPRPAPPWRADALRAGRVVLRIGDSTQEGAIDTVGNEAERSEALRAFGAAFGAPEAMRWFGRDGLVLAVELGTATDGVPADPYGRWLTAEFDSTATGYLAGLDRSPAETVGRSRSLALLRAVFPRPARLLELGSGPGAETLALLHDGHEVTAIDVSARMLAELEGRAHDQSVDGRLRTVRLRLRNVVELQGPFDGAFSTFGALNCEPDLTPVAAGIGRLLAPDGRMVAGFFQRTSWREMFYYTIGGRPGRALARLRSPVIAGAGRFPVDWYPWSQHEVVSAFSPDFVLERRDGSGLVAPPPETEGRFRRVPGFLVAANRLDARVGRRWPAHLLSDHALLVLRRRVPPG